LRASCCVESLMTRSIFKLVPAQIAPARLACVTVLAFVMSVTLAGCEVPAPQRRVYAAHERVVEAPPPPVDTTVYAYPQKGQSAEQQDRDRYECYVWAVKQTGFDPSAPGVLPHQRVVVVARNPAPSNIPGAAATGAVIGAVTSNPYHSGEGAIIGAIAGATIGAIADSQREPATPRASAQPVQATAQDQKAVAYRRALSACLGGRGYNVN